MFVWNSRLTIATFGFIFVLSGCTSNEDNKSIPKNILQDKAAASSAEYSYQHRSTKLVYWGDSHLHSSYSTDAGLFGDTLDPGMAYRFAKGETVTSSTGIQAKLKRPLDWLVIADHAENLGLVPLAMEGDPRLLASEWGKKFHELIKAGNIHGAFSAWGLSNAAGKNPFPDEDAVRSIWDRSLQFAKQHNEPGKFTALLGYEWTSSPKTNNLHRVVVFRDNEDRAGRVLPFSAYDSQDPEKLWDWMSEYEASTGGEIFAIAHNGNLSNGLMFDDFNYEGGKLDEEYARRRSRWEPLYEVTQIKGDGETHPLLSPDDEFADYETWDSGNFGHAAKTQDMLPKEYAREALKRGLVYERSLGANPFKFGLIGASDAHTSLSAVSEANFFGKAPMLEPRNYPYRWEGKLTGVGPQIPGEPDSPDEIGLDTASSGLQGVWAEANTRHAIFDAMKRKETYATTGSRIVVRVFGGYEFDQADLAASDFADRGYAGGVPMGGELRLSAKPPRFMVQALKDPDGGNLDRVQIVKGWVDEYGEAHENVIDIACAPGANGVRKIIKRNGNIRCAEHVGSTVVSAKAEYANTIGSASLSALWEDASFKSSQSAFYYVRVLEIPTPRWSTFDAMRDQRELPVDVPVEQQERAYTSPIWYQPAL